MLPLSLLNASVGQSMQIELKSGETYNGELVEVDAYMNIKLKNVIFTSRNGQIFKKMNECYVRGSGVKFMKLSDQVLEEAKKKMIEQAKKASEQYHKSQQQGQQQGGQTPYKKPYRKKNTPYKKRN